MILALSLGESVVNHFARRCCGEIQSSVALNDEVGDEVRRVRTTFPCRDRRMR